MSAEPASFVQVIVHNLIRTDDEPGIGTRVACSCGWVGYTTLGRGADHFRDHADGKLWWDNGWPRRP